MSQALTKAEIVAGLHQLGLKAGDGVMVHSSLKSFGRVAEGPKTVIAALMEVLTPAGTLMMPSFNHGAAFRADGPGYFDPAETPTTNGAIPNLFWQLPGVQRSLHPTHSFAVWGQNARAYTKDHHRTLTAGPDSPLGLLWRDGGYGLLLGVDYTANTFHHVVEAAISVPCLGWRTSAYPIRLPDGRNVKGRAWTWRKEECPINEFGLYEPAMRPYERAVQIGSCRAVLFRLEDAYPVIARFLQEGTDELPACRNCPIRPHNSPRNVPTDWDAANQRILPDSDAWTY